MSDHPYRRLPPQAFWRKTVAGIDPATIDPVGRFDLSITPDMKVATAGSCFAQHIARHLKHSGFNYFVAEQAHPLIGDTMAAAHNYGLFSARYGNIYTARQLRQTMQRALGAFTPKDDVWAGKGGGVVDPFRPSIQPGGFRSEAEMRADRRQHLAYVRRMFRELDVFVFTLGLTEGWLSRADGAAYPICPGVEGGTFDPDAYVFHNQNVIDVLDDMRFFLSQLQAVNRRAQVILTVSPVPLAATAVPGQHVLAATTYSKSVLRAAAGMLADEFAHVHYFPSYEIITSAASRGRYFAEDLRNVTEEGVGHVMRTFLARATTPAEQGGTASTKQSGAKRSGAAPAARPTPHAGAGAGATAAGPDDFLARMDTFVEVICDEEKLAQ